MCNAYRIPAKKITGRLAAQVHEVISNMLCTLIRKTDSAPVVVSGGSVEIMRWGFSRHFKQAINNARGDKLASTMWENAFQQRRCLVPMALFYEWAPTPHRKGKQAHAITQANGSCMWAAGIWEEHPDLGHCFSIITTSANQDMAQIHHRMPALIPEEQTEGFLHEPNRDIFVECDTRFVVQPCESPLAAPATNPDQPELW